MMKLLPDEGQLVTVAVGERFIWLDFPDGLAMGRSSSRAPIPNMRASFRRGHKHFVRCQADSLAMAIDRVATIGSEHKDVSLSIDPKGGLTVICENREVGVGRDRLDTVEVSRPKRVLSFNHRYPFRTVLEFPVWAER
jgi:hypothetical protein